MEEGQRAENMTRGSRVSEGSVSGDMFANAMSKG